jgi:putative tricarboxylic transport membrane protein
VTLWSNLWLGFGVAFTPLNLVLALAGAFLGTLIGALPGIGSTSGVALLLPLTFGMEPTSAIILMSGIYYGSMYGGTITSVLINTPGESATIVTTLDGYQLARQGRAGAALGIATIASFVAGTCGTAALMLMAPALARAALRFGPPEYFALTLLGITMLATLGTGSRTKAFISALVGLILATAGIDVMTGSTRFTFGSVNLMSGFDFLPISIGLFGLTEILLGTDEAERIRRSDVAVRVRQLFPSREDWTRSRAPIARGTVLGFLIGCLPGAGATIASFASYYVEKRVSRTPERFGRGAIEGVAGPEAANNAASAGSLVPLLTLGLPGGTTTAVLVGAFVMWGLRPGPLLFDENPAFVWGLIASMYIGNVMLVAINILMIPMFVRILRVPYEVLMPAIVVLCMVGAYAANNRMWDVGLMLGFGGIGYVMRKLEYSPAALVSGLVLGPLAENAFRQSLQISDGSYAIFFTRPLAGVLMLAAGMAVAWPLLASWTGGRGPGGRSPASSLSDP